MSMGHVYVWEPVIDTNAYADGDVLGTGNPYEITEFPKYAGAVQILQSALVRDKANQKMGIDLLFFSEAPTGTYTNNAAFAIDAADKARYIGRLSVVAGDYTTLAAAFAEATIDGIGKALAKASSETSESLWMIAAIRGAGTYAVGDLSARLTFITGDRR